jgi:hypothetical protein
LQACVLHPVAGWSPGKQTTLASASAAPPPRSQMAPLDYAQEGHRLLQLIQQQTKQQ